MQKETIAWISVAALVILAIGSLSLVINPNEFSIVLKDGTIKARYKEGILKVYSGRYLAFQDEIKPYYWNGSAYIRMYKARGLKYSNLSYHEEGEITFLKQVVYYSRGNLTRYFEIAEDEIKESFEFIPENPGLRTYFRWDYSGLDEIPEKIVYFDRKKRYGNAMMDFNIINSWQNEIGNTARVERFRNGKMTIRTRVFEGKAAYDPTILLAGGNITIIEDENCEYINYNESINIPGTCRWHYTDIVCEDEPVNKSCSLQEVSANYSCANGTKSVERTERACHNPKSYSIIDTFSDMQYSLDYSGFGKCSYSIGGSLIITCDSKLDGNNDGICQAGESCMKFIVSEDGIQTLFRNSMDEFTEDEGTFRQDKLSLEVI